MLEEGGYTRSYAPADFRRDRSDAMTCLQGPRRNAL